VNNSRRWFLSGERLAQREAASLAPYAMRGSQSRGRRNAEKIEDDRAAFRGVFQRDRDRIIHSSAFRRMEYKTQVFVNHEGDHFRTRLTHTLEVAQIARSMARALMLNEDLTEAIALAHDVGHTPFGHSGEQALAELMREHGGFEHNLHGLRVVDKLERRYPHFDGLNLTYEVRESILKHSTLYDRLMLGAGDCPSPGRSEAQVPRELLEEFDPLTRPLLEAQIVDGADEIAYNNHDLADGLEMGIIDRAALQQVALWAEARDRVQHSIPEAPERVKDLQTVAWLIHQDVLDLVDTSYRALQEHGITSVDAVRRHPGNVIAHSEPFAARRKELQSYLFRYVYRHYKVIRMTRKAKMFIAELFAAYLQTPGQLPPTYYARIEGGEPAPRVVCDYIASMTDRYAQDEYKRLFYPFERV